MPDRKRSARASRGTPLLLLALAASACGKGGSVATADARPCSSTSSADARAPGGYHVVHGWPALAEGYVLGQVSGVALDAHGDVLVFHRADHPWLAAPDTVLITQPTILRLDAATGVIKEALGAGLFIVPHGLRVDAKGHLWVTDVGLQQVFELDATGKILRSFGTAGVAGTDATHFDQPTDVAVAPDGTLYISDGYGNSRVVELSASGAFVKEWGTFGTGPGQFDTPHSIALDDAGRVYVADRGNARIQRFDRDGKFLDEWHGQELGRPWAVTVAADGSVFVVDGGDQNPTPPDHSRLLRLDQSGKVLESWGSFGNYDGQLYWGHALAVSPGGDVFVGDVHYGMRVQKFVR
jgi:peptidylamidoglycolate lyase